MINYKKRTKKHKKQVRWLLGICGALVLVLGISIPLVVAQNDSGLKQQEDQLIKQYVLPKAPSKEPVYKPVPAPPPPQQEAPPPRRETPVEPRQEAPPPRRETPVEPRQEAPPPRRETPVEPRQEAPPEPRQEAPPPTRREKNVEPEPAPEETRIRGESPRPREDELPEDESPTPKRGAIERETETSEEPSSEDIPDSERLQRSRPTTAVSLPTGQYTLEFNRSPVVGDRLRLRGVYSEARIGFTRPFGWKIQSAKVAVRFQHSPALIASRSNLTVRVNGSSIGSIPLNRKESQIGQAVFNIPAKLIQNYNELSVVAQQNNHPECSDPADATLWTEILSDSKIIFTYQPQPIPLNFSRYPYPFFDQLSLDSNRIVYLLPKINEAWLTSAPRLQASLGRFADFRPIDTRIVKSLNQVRSNERLVVIGTPADQPSLKSLDLPFKISAKQILDGSKNPLAEEVGRARLYPVLQPLPTDPNELKQLGETLAGIDPPGPEFILVYRNLLATGVRVPFLNFRIAQLLLESGDIVGARTALATYAATPEGARDLAPQLLAAEIERREGNLEAAALRYQGLIASNRADNDILNAALRGLSGIRVQQNRTVEAVAIFDQLVARNPQDVTLQLARASLAYRAKLIDESQGEAVLNYWLQTNPNAGAPPELFALVGILPANPRREALYNALTQIDPNNLPVQLRLLQVIAQRNPAVARARLVQLVARDPNNLGNYFLQGELAKGIGELEVAGKAYETILSALPYNLDALSALGGIRFQQRRFDSATELYSQALAIKPNDLTLRQTLISLTAASDKQLAALAALEALQLEQFQKGIPNNELSRQRQQIQEGFLQRRGFQPPWERF